MISMSVLLKDSFQDPKAAAAQLLALNLPLNAALGLLAGAVAASVVMLFAMNGFEPVPLLPSTLVFGPMALAITVCGLNILMVLAVQYTGRLFDGQCSFAQSAIIIAWVQILQFLLQLVQIGLGLLSIGIAALFGLISLIYVLWATAHFISVLHGLDSAVKGFLVFIIAILAVGFGLSILLTVSGLAPMFFPEVTANGL